MECPDGDGGQQHHDREYDGSALHSTGYYDTPVAA
jgi:hypothetical protein